MAGGSLAQASVSQSVRSDGPGKLTVKAGTSISVKGGLWTSAFLSGILSISLEKFNQLMHSIIELQLTKMKSADAMGIKLLHRYILVSSR